MWKRVLTEGFVSPWLGRAVLLALFAWASWVCGYVLYAINLPPVDDEPLVDNQALILSPPRRILDARPLREAVILAGRPGDLLVTYRQAPVHRIGDGRRWSVVFIAMGDQRLARHGGEGPAYAALARYMRAVRNLVDRRHTQVVFIRVNPAVPYGPPRFWQGAYWTSGCGEDGGCYDRYLLGGQQGYAFAHAWARALLHRAGYKAVDVRTLPIVVLLDPADRVVALWWGELVHRDGFPLTSLHLARAIATLQRRAGVEVHIPQFPRHPRPRHSILDVIDAQVLGYG